MNPDDRYAALAQTAAGVMNTMPPRENPRVNKSMDSVHASGPLGRAHCVINGNSNYKQTGMLQAYAAAHLLQQPPEARRLRLRLPGVRPSRAARAIAQLRARQQACSDRARLSQSRVARSSASPATASGVDHALHRLPGQRCLARRRRAVPHHGWTRPQLWRGAGAELPRRARARAIGHCCRREGRQSFPATIRSRLPACSAFPAQARSGARSIRATRRPKIGSSSSNSTAACCCFIQASRRWSRRCVQSCQSCAPSSASMLSCPSRPRSTAGSPALQTTTINARRSTISR